MKKAYQFIILIFLISSNLRSQTKIELSINEGFVFYDLFKNQNDVNHTFLGYGIFNNFTIYALKPINKKFDIRTGLGFTPIYNLSEEFYFFEVGGSGGRSITPYLNGKIGMDYKLTEKTKISAIFNNYFYLKKDLQGYNQKRYFLNMDLEMRFALSKNWDFNIGLPIPLSSFYSGLVVVFDNYGTGTTYKLKTEMTGLVLGINYKF